MLSIGESVAFADNEQGTRTCTIRVPDPTDFKWLDEIMDTLAANGIYASMGTATASTPAWMARKYPEILPIDENGLTLHHGSRQNFNPNSPVYRRLSARLVRKLAERYRDHPDSVSPPAG